MLRSLASVSLAVLPLQAVAERAHSATQRDPIEAYVEANVTETLFHELAHAIFDLGQIPVLGPEEFAADTFSAVMLHRLHSEDELRAMVYDIADNYIWFADQAGDRVDDLALWDVHGPDLQRYYNFVCLIYGANIEERDDIADELGLPEGRIESCEEEYELAAWSWDQVLARFEPKRGSQTIVLDWVLNKNSALTEHVRDEIGRLNTIVAMPQRLNVSVIPCGESNAFYDPDYSEIQICTELGVELAERAKDR